MGCTECSGSSSNVIIRYKGEDIECIGIEKCDTFDVIVEKLSEAICDINFQDLDHIAFTSSTGAPSNVPGQPCETDTYTVWGDVAETINLGTFTVYNGCDSELGYAQVAWVDKTYGNDATGQTGRFDLPFLTVSAAMAAAEYIHLRQGKYTEYINIVDGKTVYAESGVEFTAGGLIDPVATGKTFRFLGKAIFTGTSEPAIIQTDATIEFECDYVDNTSVGFYFSSIVNYTVRCNYIKSEGELGGFVNSIRDTASGEFHIKEFCEGYYSPFFFRGSAEGYYTGTTKIFCPENRVIEGGVYGSIDKSPLNVSLNDGANITVNGNLYCLNTTPDINPNGAIYHTLTADNITTINMNGDIIAGVETGVLTGFGGNKGIINISGNIKSDTYPIDSRRAGAIVRDHDFNLYSSIIHGGDSVLIGQGTDFKFKDCSFYNSTTNGNNVYAFDTGAVASTLYFYNCIGESAGALGFFAIDNGGYPLTTGLVQSNANKALDASITDTWAGFAQVAALVVPKI